MRILSQFLTKYSQVQTFVKRSHLFTKSDLICWLVTLTVIAIDAAWLIKIDWLITNISTPLIALGLLIVFIFTAFNLGIAITTMARPQHPEVDRVKADINRRTWLTIHYTSLMFIFLQAMIVLIYLTLTLDTQTIDTQLDRVDKLMGFDWLGIYNWTEHSPMLNMMLNGTYYTLGVQMLIIPFILGAMGNDRHLRELTAQQIAAFLIMIMISTPYPAYGTFSHYGVGSSNDLALTTHFAAIRQHTFDTLNFGELQGLVSMPSMHAALAILLTYALRSFSLLFIAACLFNTVMIISTPTEGGHYLVDTLAGILLGIITILISRCLMHPKSTDHHYSHISS